MFCNFALVSHSVQLIVILSQCHVWCLSVNVSWEVVPPAVFGSTMYLSCRISDDAYECSRSIRQWLGGPDNEPLCQNNECGTDPKYKVMTEPNVCSYTLMIYNFSIFDVECDYTCSYGVEIMKKSLKLNDDDFIYEPTKDDKKSHIKIHSNRFSYVLVIERIYPSPQCFVTYQGLNLRRSTEVHTTKPGIMYATRIHVNSVLLSCGGNLLVECFLGNRKINVTEEQINTCEDQRQDTTTFDLEILTVLVIIPSIIVILALYVRIRRRSQRKETQNNESDFTLNTPTRQFNDL